jgi:hypothetical protein
MKMKHMIDGDNARYCWMWTATQMICLLLLASRAAAAPVYPLEKSANGRYLVDQNNTPFLITGDAPQALIVNLDAADQQIFLNDRATNGFNTVWINLLCNTYTGGRADGSTFDGIPPFTSIINADDGSYDLTTPNPAYFARVDQALNFAAQQGLLVMLDPIETGGWMNTIADNGLANCRAYGQYLGNRYKNFSNIIWINGNDYAEWTDTNADALVRAVALGIQDNDTNHIQTVELAQLVDIDGLQRYDGSSLDDSFWDPIISLNATYTYRPTYAQVLMDYNRTNSIPSFMAEANYEFENDWISNESGRRQEYWSLLSGSCGQIYGNHFTWQFLPDWKTELDTAGSTQLGYVKNLFAPRRWYDLIPDQGHTLVTSGNGTFVSTGTVNDSDYATAARTADGTLAIVYMPTTRTITVDLSQLGSPVTAQWYDPSSGLYTTVPGSPFTNSVPQDFTPASTNADGDGDWALLLESSANTNVTIWEVSMAGKPRATCVLQLADDLTVTGYGIEQSLCGTFSVTGIWSQELKGGISGTLSQLFSSTNCQHTTSIEGTFATKPIKTAQISASGLDSLGKLRWKAVRGPSFPSLATGWQGTLKIKKSVTEETYNLTPGASKPGWYDIMGQAADASYTFTGALIVTSRNLVTASIVRQLPGGSVASFYTGKVNLTKHTLSLKGTDATGAKHRISAVAQ